MSATRTTTVPTDSAYALRSVKAAGDLGRQLADFAATMFGPGLSPHLRALFEAELLAAVPDLFADWHGRTAEDRIYLQRVAAMVFDRRLAMHAALATPWGGEA